jgi:hypothetical protein
MIGENGLAQTALSPNGKVLCARRNLDAIAFSAVSVGEIRSSAKSRRPAAES